MQQKQLQTEYWQLIKKSNDKSRYLRYLEIYPNGNYRALARSRSSEGSERLSVGRKFFYLTLFVVAFLLLGATQAGASEDLKDDVFWANVSGCRDAAEVELYLSEFPSGRHVEAARACLEKLNRPDLVELLGRGLSAAARDAETGWTDLHYAAAADLPEEIADLVGVGVPVDARLASVELNLFGIGVERRFGQRLREVLSALGHGEAFQGWRADGQTALMVAVYVGARMGAAALVSHGADIGAKNDVGRTSLHYAAWGDSTSALEWLVSLGADIGAKDDVGNTPLHYAAWFSSVSALEWLVSHGADIGAKNGYGSTPLHFAAWGDSTSTLEWLVSHGADIGAKNDDGHTPLHYAAWYSSVSMLESLVSRGADVDAKDNRGETPLHHAVREGSVSALEWLMLHGANVGARNDYGNTPLHAAVLALGDSVSVLESLVSHGADIDVRNNDDETPLHYAAWGDSVSALEWLVSHGADIGAKNNNGETPLQVASDDARVFLRSLGAN